MYWDNVYRPGTARYPHSDNDIISRVEKFLESTSRRPQRRTGKLMAMSALGKRQAGGPMLTYTACEQCANQSYLPRTPSNPCHAAKTMTALAWRRASRAACSVRKAARNARLGLAPGPVCTCSQYVQNMSDSIRIIVLRILGRRHGESNRLFLSIYTFFLHIIPYRIKS